MFKDVKVGEKLWSVNHGWGEVKEVTIHKNTKYPIIVYFSDIEHSVSYTIEGKHYVNDTSPTLFWNEFEIPKEAYVKPLPNLKVDTKVLVWDIHNKGKIKAHFSHFNKDGRIATFINGRTSWSSGEKETYSWNYYEVIEG